MYQHIMLQHTLSSIDVHTINVQTIIVHTINVQTFNVPTHIYLRGGGVEESISLGCCVGVIILYNTLYRPVIKIYLGES